MFRNIGTIFMITVILIFHHVSATKTQSLLSLDPNKPKVGILSLSAIKLSPLIQEQYKIQSSSSKPNNNSINEFLHNTGYVAKNYTQWLASRSIQVLPILFFENLKQILHLMDSLDAFVLTGVTESFSTYETTESLYLLRVKHILQKAKEINDGGRRFPVWGTCLGFETLHLVESNNTLKRHQVFNHVKLRELIRITDTSLRSVKYFTEGELYDMEDIPLLYFNHMWGLSRWVNKNLPELGKRVSIGTKIDTDRRRNVVVWMEFRDYPFLGTQFHPEKRGLQAPIPLMRRGLRVLRRAARLLNEVVL